MYCYLIYIKLELFKGKKILTNFLLSMNIIFVGKILVLMNSKNHTVEQAREFLRREALNEICSVPDYNKFHDQIFCVFAKYGLLLTAKEEGFFSGDEWSNPDPRDVLIKRVKQFLDKHIR